MLTELDDTTSSIEWNITPEADLADSYEAALSVYPSSVLNGNKFLKLVKGFAPATLKGHRNWIKYTDSTESMSGGRTLDGLPPETVTNITSTALIDNWVAGFNLDKEFISAVCVNPRNYEFMTHDPIDKVTIFFNASRTPDAIKDLGSFVIRGIDILNVRRQLMKSGISIQKLRENSQLTTGAYGLVKPNPPTSP